MVQALWGAIWQEICCAQERMSPCLRGETGQRKSSRTDCGSRISFRPAKPVRIPGAVSLSIDAEGEASNFYADDGVYYVINNNSGYTGDLEIALVPLEFATDILGEKLDEKGVLTETNTAEVSQFALLFEFSGDKNKIRHCLFCCSASRPATESSTIEDEKEVKTETLSLTATALNSGLVKTKTCEKTDAEVYENWYKAVYMPNLAAAVQSGKASAASVKA